MRDAYHIKALRVAGKPWSGKIGPDLKDYFIEIGDTKYGKKGSWKAELDVGVFEKGFMYQLETEMKLSNPEVFEEAEIIIRKIGYA
jgi:hypothetical protein